MDSPGFSEGGIKVLNVAPMLHLGNFKGVKNYSNSLNNSEREAGPDVSGGPAAHGVIIKQK